MSTPSVSRERHPHQRPEALIWPPLVISQGGAREEPPNHPLAAFESALREGAEGIVLDVELSSDGVPVVTYDTPLRRKTAGCGGAMNAPSHIALLTHVLQWVRDQKCMAVVAINHPTPGAEVKILKAIAEARVRHVTRVMANDLTGLQRIRKLDAKVHVGLRFTCHPPALRDVKALGAEVLWPHWTSASPTFIACAHQAEMVVIPWTVDNPRQMRRTILDGADGVITNYPAKLTQIVSGIQEGLRVRAV